MTDMLADWWVHAVKVERYGSAGADGDSYTTSDDVPCLVHDGAKIVVGANGETVTASATLAFPPDVPRIPPGSYVTLPALFGGRRSLVISSAIGDAGDQPTPNHQEVGLQ